ncbi:uncharacterized protein IWZ02DRAFT_168634 [Phyllosticta citriasiana]|uniref:Zn(2)-C6 fungal-type domain-containing protein n=1 Tax=Phyllosticta citriasiana TaxID=595635 RepID=A0ABR1KHX4_9PEZI
MLSRNNSPSPSSKPPRIRQSCDSCQRSKVKCSQDRPVCTRCQKHGYNCVYSPSRRAGRPRLRRPGEYPLPRPSDAVDSAKSQPAASPIMQITPDVSRANTPPQPLTPPSTSSSASPDHMMADLSQLDLPHSLDTMSPPLDPFVYDNGAHNFLHDFFDCFHHDLIFPEQSSHSDVSKFDFGSCLPDEHANGQNAVYDCYTIPDPELPNQPVTLNASCPEWGSRTCSLELVECLFQNPPSQTPIEANTGRVAAAIQKTRELSNRCRKVLCCTTCSSRSSTVLMVCEAVDQALVALDLGSIWSDSAVEHLDQPHNLLNEGLSREEATIQCGTYSIRGLDRRFVLRALLLKRLGELKETLDKLQSMVSSPISMASALPCYKTCVDIIGEVSSTLDTKTDFLKLAL